jgi:hypothetical protein
MSQSNMSHNLNIDQRAKGPEGTDGPLPGEPESVPLENVKNTVGNWKPRQAYDYGTYGAAWDPELPCGEPYGQWAASGVRYEWQEESGDVAPRDERREKTLFGDENYADFQRLVADVDLNDSAKRHALSRGLSKELKDFLCCSSPAKGRLQAYLLCLS